MALNVMEHEMVPEHYLLQEEEAEEVLRRLKVGREQLPKVRKDDPCIKFLERNLEMTIEEGRIVKVIRRSPTAGVFVAYRVVAER
ncbi:MAG: DNA-directed RNA polymerase subunit H [Thermoplasmata archaeon]